MAKAGSITLHLSLIYCGISHNYSEIYYEHIFSDPRVENWFLMKSPVPTLLIVAAYLLICICGPMLMKNRKPFNLKFLIIPYNFALVGLSAYMFYELLMSAILANYSLKCQPVDYSNNPLSLRMARVNWLFFFSKFIEFFDSFFIILRGKTNQLSFLHVYHHSTMVIIWWSGVKYVAGGQSFFIPLLNSFVHTMMYVYYGLAAIGPHMQKYLWWKRYMTRIQLTQFVMVLVHSGYNMFMTNCNFHQGFNVAAMSYSLSLTLLFTNFYVREYIHIQKQKQHKN
ncbi:very long chain fatty acid elongase 4-like [Tubulanus polymorphus]|uniref:very long chain fatty acid elongase 4-like n=1 Tax=Tubulanus polymorphus TaxID=672921 RepID=UPI003DA61DBB